MPSSLPPKRLLWAVRAECPENRKCPQANNGPFSTPGLIPMRQLEPIHTPVTLPRTRAPPALNPQTPRIATPGLDPPALGSPSLLPFRRRPSFPSVAPSAESGTTQPITPSSPPARFRLEGSGQASRTPTAKGTQTDPPEACAVPLEDQTGRAAWRRKSAATLLNRTQISRGAEHRVNRCFPARAASALIFLRTRISEGGKRGILPKGAVPDELKEGFRSKL